MKEDSRRAQARARAGRQWIRRFRPPWVSSGWAAGREGSQGDGENLTEGGRRGRGGYGRQHSQGGLGSD